MYVPPVYNTFFPIPSSMPKCSDNQGKAHWRAYCLQFTFNMDTGSANFGPRGGSHHLHSDCSSVSLNYADGLTSTHACMVRQLIHMYTHCYVRIYKCCHSLSKPQYTNITHSSYMRTFACQLPQNLYPLEVHSQTEGKWLLGDHPNDRQKNDGRSNTGPHCQDTRG